MHTLVVSERERKRLSTCVGGTFSFLSRLFIWTIILDFWPLFKLCANDYITSSFHFPHYDVLPYYSSVRGIFIYVFIFVQCSDGWIDMRKIWTYKIDCFLFCQFKQTNQWCCCRTSLMSELTSVQVLFLYQEAELHTFWCDIHLRSLA